MATRRRRNERADNRIMLSVELGHDEQGRRRRKYFYGATRLEAERKRDEYLETVKGKRPRADMTLSQWIDSYLQIYPSGANPLYSSQHAVPYNHLRAALGERQLSAIRESDLQAFVNSLSGKSQSTISKQILTIKKVFAKARKNKLLDEDPSEDLIAPRAVKGTHRALTKDEVRLILRYWDAPGNYSGLWMMIMLFAGLRRGEMMALDWSCIDMTQRTLTVRQTAVIVGNKAVIEQRTKSAAGVRIVPIVEPLYQALLSVPESRRNGLVCLSANGKPLTESAVSRGLERFLGIVNRAACGEPLNQPGRRTDLRPLPAPLLSFRYHDLRHTYCTMLYDSGVDVKSAAYLMGHADVTVTMKIYTHLSESKQANSTALLSDYLRSLTP